MYAEPGWEQAFVSKMCNSPDGRSISPFVYPMLHGEVKENISANWEKVGLHQEVRKENLDPILIKPSNETVVKNTHVKNNAFQKRQTETETETETFLNLGYNILAIYENEQ